MVSVVSPRLPFGNGTVFVCRKLADLHDDFRVVVCVSGTIFSYGNIAPGIWAYRFGRVGWEFERVESHWKNDDVQLAPHQRYIYIGFGYELSWEVPRDIRPKKRQVRLRISLPKQKIHGTLLQQDALQRARALHRALHPADDFIAFLHECLFFGHLHLHKSLAPRA